MNDLGLSIPVILSQILSFSLLIFLVVLVVVTVYKLTCKNSREKTPPDAPD